MNTAEIFHLWVIEGDYEKECLDDETVGAFLQKTLFEEIIPTLGNSPEDIAFGKAVLDRFANPFVKHQLLSIALNSVSKFKARVLPTLTEYYEAKGEVPKCMTFSLAALIAFYRTDEANDNEEITEFMKTASVADILKKEQYWGKDLSFLLPEVEHYYELMTKQGMAKAYAEVLA